MEVKFDRERMLRLIKNDNFLTFVWKKSLREDENYLEAMFNTYILEDCVLSKEYLAV